jgi:hypothetical protein
MPISPMYVQPLSFQQANPGLMGAQMGSDLVSSAFQNQIRNLQAQQMAMQNQVLPQTLQEQLQRLQLGNQAQGITNQYLPQTLQSENTLRGAQAGLMGTESQKNQFQINNPWTMMNGIPGQIGGLGYLVQHNPNMFNATPNAAGAQVTSGASSTGQILPPSPATQGGLAALNSPNATLPQPNVPVMMQGVSGGGEGDPAIQSPAPGGLAPGVAQPQTQPQAGQLFGGNGFANQLVNSMMAQMQLPAARAAYYNQKVTGASYLDAPPDTKRYLIAQATAFGINPDQAARDFIAGKSLGQMAQDKGFGSEQGQWPTPDFMPTVATLSRNQMRQTAVSELTSVEPFINGALGQYSQTIGSYSPSQVIDSFNSLNNNTPEGQAKKDKLSDFLAATVVVPEYNAIRARAMGVQNIGVEAMQNIGKASMNNFNKFQSLVPSDVYMAAQTKANNLIRQMNSAATKASLVPFQQQQNSSQMPNAQTLTNAVAPQMKVINGTTYHNINGQWYQQ